MHLAFNSSTNPSMGFFCPLHSMAPDAIANLHLSSFSCYWPSMPCLVLCKVTAGHTQLFSPGCVEWFPCETSRRWLHVANRCLMNGQARHALSAVGTRKWQRSAWDCMPRASENRVAKVTPGSDGWAGASMSKKLLCAAWMHDNFALCY